MSIPWNQKLHLYWGGGTCRVVLAPSGLDYDFDVGTCNGPFQSDFPFLKYLSEIRRWKGADIAQGSVECVSPLRTVELNETHAAWAESNDNCLEFGG